MTRTLILGANGGVGQHLVKQMHAQGEDFTAAVRKKEQQQALASQGISATLIDLETATIDDLTDAFLPYDQVIFSVGSGGSTGADKTIIVDLDGAVKAIKASEAANIEHFIMVSTYDSRREAFDASGDLKPYTIAKHYADDYLRHSRLTTTIVHPGALTNDQGTGKVNVAELFEQPDVRQIPREDVATVLYEVATNAEHRGKEFQVLTGNNEISEALSFF
ncbi:NAD(P)-binding oxidoreductase [Staphylococcus pseudintermedius]|uniref:NAD(P)-binding oxidoreductase n=1 Tax=Staphylococcus pseudintermedius TaxID=283734 RepID=UPI000D733855|nr:NAD(P)-binding oxidoreductase [Staphylococcus pseudintermedius]EGQ1656930.1 NAD(P)-dependent oxidoreductase [Staphylococcus pseudintermedius]EGQ1775560.1 NAD(P)-dependent oxidoreductase [Staphylococcus pseudintermedius]EGQ2883609.1 NAD(P)-dependent oxidoreductase [Staphylococcus pseudintermedius]EGQ3228524.1 SDR family oxidoreductase [Staphylococcus pseudintermedius]EGQ3334686.1 SDR family oxidoreductase [Staphylococcus pseudintermedius]